MIHVASDGIMANKHTPSHSRGIWNKSQVFPNVVLDDTGMRDMEGSSVRDRQHQHKAKEATASHWTVPSLSRQDSVSEKPQCCTQQRENLLQESFLVFKGIGQLTHQSFHPRRALLRPAQGSGGRGWFQLGQRYYRCSHGAKLGASPTGLLMV